MRREWHQLSYPGVGNQALQTSRPSTDSAEDSALGLDRWRDLPRVQTPPSSRKVAVRWFQHSPILGQRASSQTV